MLNGCQDVDIDEIRAYTIYQGEYHDHHCVVVWLWDTLREFTMDQRKAFLMFVTGTSRVPLDGFDPPFNLTEGIDDNDVDKALPRAHTSFNQIVIPQYSSKDTLCERLLFAINNTEGFQLA